MKTAELTGVFLDYVVATTFEGGETGQATITLDGKVRFFRLGSTPIDGWESEPLNYSTNWAHGGPIIDREKIDLISDALGTWTAELWAYHDAGADSVITYGSTPLEAAMRCYCASKLGDEVEIPEELL